jgi:hypothetical protein
MTLISKWMRRVFAVSGLVLIAPAAHADILALKDGRIVEGPKITQEEDFVVITYKNGEIQVPYSLVLSVISETASDYVPRTDEEKEQYKEGLAPYKDKWLPIAKRRKLIEKETAKAMKTIEEDRAHSEWGTRRTHESKNFRWEYTVPEHVKEAFVSRCESYYTIFTKDWKVKRDKRKKKMMMNFFRDIGEFHQVGGGGSSGLAYFMFLGDYDLCLFHDATSMEFTEMVLYHELSHYLQKLLNEDFRVPHWPGEGVAEYYGGALWDAKKKMMNIGLLQEGRLAEVKNDIASGTRLKLKEVVTKQAYTDYTWGWTLVHFFMSDTKMKKGFQKYLKGLANDKNVKRNMGQFNLWFVSPDESLRYLMECLDIKDEQQLAQLEQDWYAYIDTELVMEGVGGLEKGAVGAMNEGKRLRAKRLFKEALEAGSVSANIHYRYAGLIKYEDRGQALELLQKAVELDPVTAVYWYTLGDLLEDDDEEEGRRIKKMAIEMDPSVERQQIDFTKLGEQE